MVWPFNSLANVIRGSGNMAVPAAVTCAGVLGLIPLSPCLIFGLGPAAVAGYGVGSRLEYLLIPLVFGLGGRLVAMMIEAGSRYLRAVGPVYGLFGLGMALYFASQGAGRLLWPLLANFARLLIASAGGWLALRWTGSLTAVFVALSIALATFGLINATAVARGAWLTTKLVQP